MHLDLVVVAAAVLALVEVARRGQVADDAEGAPLGDAQAGRDVAEPHPRVVREEQQHASVVTQEAPAAHTPKSTIVSGKNLPVSGCRRRGLGPCGQVRAAWPGPGGPGPGGG